MRPVSQAEAELDLQYMEFCEKSPLVEIPRWFFREIDVEIHGFYKEEKTSRTEMWIKSGAFIYVDAKIVATVVHTSLGTNIYTTYREEKN